MTDFLDVGGVQLPVDAETWTEERIEVGDIGDDVAMSGRPIESRAAIVRKWEGQLNRNVLAAQNITGTEPLTSTSAKYERLLRWIEGWGQCFPLVNAQNISGAGLALAPAGNLTTSNAGGPYATGKVTISSGLSAGFTAQYALRLRRGFTPTAGLGWSIGFWRNFVAAEDAAAGYHWCVATGKVAVAQGSGNPAGVTQYIDGAAANFHFGNVCDTTVSLWGKTTPNANSAIEFADLFVVPFQMPAKWISSIFTNLVGAATKLPFPILPRQKLTGDWLTHEDAPVEAIGRVPKVRQRVGKTKQDTQWQQSLRDVDVAFREW